MTEPSVRGAFVRAVVGRLGWPRLVLLVAGLITLGALGDYSSRFYHPIGEELDELGLIGGLLLAVPLLVVGRWRGASWATGWLKFAVFLGAYGLGAIVAMIGLRFVNGVTSTAQHEVRARIVDVSSVGMRRGSTHTMTLVTADGETIKVSGRRPADFATNEVVVVIGAGGLGHRFVNDLRPATD